MSGILEGIRVLDLTRYISGPYCGVMLADMGAEVIKIEKPDGGEETRRSGPWKDGVSLFYPAYNRNKKSATINLRSDRGKELFRELIQKSDVLIENFRVGTMAKMGFSYEQVKAINPRIIMVSVTGFGQTGPFKDRPAFDGIISAMSAISKITPTGVAIGNGAPSDFFGSMYAALGTLLALYDREKTGKGQYIDVSMFAAVSMLRTVWIADAAAHPGEDREKTDDTAPYGFMQGKDGWLNYHAGSEAMYKRLLTIIDDPILHDPKYESMENRVNDRLLLMDRLNVWAADKTCAELEKIFGDAGIPIGRVRTPAMLLECEQMKARGQLVKLNVPGVGELPYCAFPLKLSEHPDIEYRSAPELGQNNDEVHFGLLGLSNEEAENLRQAGVI